MENINKNTIISAILAGIYIFISTIIYLVVANEINKVLGALLFSYSIILILNNSYNLYTSKVGYLLPYKKSNFSFIVIITVVNIITVLILSLVFNLLKNDNIFNYSKEVVNIKFNRSFSTSFVYATICGVLMYTGVDAFKNIKSDFVKTLVIVFSGLISILGGFEHSIANTTFMFLAEEFSLINIGFILLMILGNGLGAIAINLLHHYRSNE